MIYQQQKDIQKILSHNEGNKEQTVEHLSVYNMKKKKKKKEAPKPKGNTITIIALNPKKWHL